MILQNWLQCPDCGSEAVEYHFGNGRLALICDGGCEQIQSFTMEKEHPFEGVDHDLQ